MRPSRIAIPRLSIAAHRARMSLRYLGPLLLAVASGLLSDCATLRQIAALGQVDFALDRVGEVRLAGVPVEGRRSLGDLSITDAAKVATAVAQRAVPLTFTAHVGAENPSTNSVSARLVALAWTAYIQDRRTVSGGLDREYVMAPGE